ncbi:MAG: ferrochelatase [Vicinamibacterales bacterium]
MAQPFEAVLFVAFGGPQGLADVQPFLQNVLRGRRVSPERVEEVAHHYERFGGVSPLTELTMKQAAALESRLRERGLDLPVRVGMRNWHPYLPDTMAALSRAGVRRAIGVVASAQRSYSGCLQYRENVREAGVALASGGLADVSVTYVSDWHQHPGFIAAHVDRIRAAFDRLPPNARADARLVFTAHSIPKSMAAEYPYEGQLVESATLVLDALSSSPASVMPCIPCTPWPTIIYQSRSGRPGDPWLEPDIGEYLRAEHARGLRALVVCPIGFLCDHVEVLYDLDVEAAETARELGIDFARAESVNAHPHFIDALADAVFSVWARYRSGRALPIVSGR